ncbi:MAG: hypothetical protein EPO06_08675 [Burkholderiaceae bacterium]|nr:MAG: hypothetical protein EPO06_08675 [Burkholderiaceae bacterium]
MNTSARRWRLPLYRPAPPWAEWVILLALLCASPAQADEMIVGAWTCECINGVSVWRYVTLEEQMQKQEVIQEKIEQIRAAKPVKLPGGITYYPPKNLTYLLAFVLAMQCR